MGKVQDCARALGEAIVASEEYQNMQLCEKAAESDPAAAEAMGRYMELHAAVNQEMGNEEPDAEKMDQVNKILEFIITGDVQEGGGCSGNCSSCGGCH